MTIDDVWREINIKINKQNGVCLAKEFYDLRKAIETEKKNAVIDALREIEKEVIITDILANWSVVSEIIDQKIKVLKEE